MGVAVLFPANEARDAEPMSRVRSGKGTLLAFALASQRMMMTPDPWTLPPSENC